MKPTSTILHGYWRSGCSWRLRIVLNLKGIEYEYKPVHLVKGEQSSEEHLKLNPAGMVPVLEVDGQVLTESMPICEYLEDAFPETKHLYPADALQKFQVRRLCEVINSGTQPIQNLGVLNRVAEFGGDKKEWAVKTIHKGLSTFEALLSQSKGKFCVGDELSFADVFLVPQLYNADRFGMDLAEFPLISAIREELKVIPEFVKADADNQPDANQ